MSLIELWANMYFKNIFKVFFFSFEFHVRQLSWWFTFKIIFVVSTVIVSRDNAGRDVIGLFYTRNDSSEGALSGYKNGKQNLFFCVC